MRKNVIILFARQVYKIVLDSKAVKFVLLLYIILFAYALYTSIASFNEQTQTRAHYRKEVRVNWESMPDKHPHRMAHYGYIAFRSKHPLSIFDTGLESYTGNAVFLEAHKQNTVNFSDAGLSSTGIRFGEISIAMLLQLLMPLLIFFVGYNIVSDEREKGTLRILLSQGATWPELVAGKTLGLAMASATILLPTLLITYLGYQLFCKSDTVLNDTLRFAVLTILYTIYFFIVSLVTVFVSSVAKTSRLALISLIGLWLLFAVLLPKTLQALGNAIYPAPSKIEFETAVEKELMKRGDSHDPNDPYYKALKDSVLKAHHVKSVEDLPFNYSGFQMKEGERISAEIYNLHIEKLMQIYQKQNALTRFTSLINPYQAVRNISMSICGTDFNSYTSFQANAENYRYRLAQHMNDLQIKLVSNKRPGDHEKPHSINSQYWKEFPDFTYPVPGIMQSLYKEGYAVLSLFAWVMICFFCIRILSKKIKAI